MTKFLTLKHWQLFIFLIGIPLLLEFVIMGYAFASRNFNVIFFCFPIMMVLFIGVFFSWFYTLGTNLFKRLPVTAKMSLTKYKVFLFIYVLYIVLFLAFMVFMFVNFSIERDPNPNIFLYIFPLHLFAMFCIIYCLYFNAKALKTIELQRPATFNDYAGEFFLLWFFPIGIWIIQPRINRLFDAAS